ncbi:MAG: mechanosensitive ion channel [Clostridia bacterium]|nr:mechanosensitive ion channel [Clostridia bacterium]
MEEIVQFIYGIEIDKIFSVFLAIGVILLFKILSSMISKLILKLLKTKGRDGKELTKNPFYLPLKTIFTYIGIYIAISIIVATFTIDPDIVIIIRKATKILMIISIARAFGESFDGKNAKLIKIKTKDDQEMDRATKRILLRTIRIFIYIIAGFMIVAEFGHNLGGLITGLGLSGVVLTLAAQDTAKSLIGGIALFVDKPFKAGDYIKINNYEGTVEDIKFRSTSIRTLEDSVLHIPNSEMAIAAIVNCGEMTKRRFCTDLVLELSTKLEDVKLIENKIQEMLIENEMVIDDTIHISFESITDNGIKLLVIAYINRSNYYEFLEIKEQINFEIINILNSYNVELAYNTQTVFIKR